MNEVAISKDHIAAMSPEAIERVRKLEAEILKQPQTKIATHHLLHAGMYSRTIMVPAGIVLTGSLMKIATILIMSGTFAFFSADDPIVLRGYNILAGSPNRKQAGVAITDTWVTMLFPTNAKTVAEAEEEFTDEGHLLFSRYEDAINHIAITGE